MESRITHFSLIIDFLDIKFNSNKISEILKKEVDEILEKNNFSNQNDWIIKLRATYNNGKQLLISKNKFGTLTSDKIKEITIVIPIPSIHKISWGCEDEQYIYKENHYDEILHNFLVLDINLSDFSNREDYILDCLRRGIKKVFQEGITVNGIKVKIK